MEAELDGLTKMGGLTVCKVWQVKTLMSEVGTMITCKKNFVFFFHMKKMDKLYQNGEATCFLYVGTLVIPNLVRYTCDAIEYSKSNIKPFDWSTPLWWKQGRRCGGRFGDAGVKLATANAVYVYLNLTLLSLASRRSISQCCWNVASLLGKRYSMYFGKVCVHQYHDKKLPIHVCQSLITLPHAQGTQKLLISWVWQVAGITAKHFNNLTTSIHTVDGINPVPAGMVQTI